MADIIYILIIIIIVLGVWAVKLYKDKKARGRRSWRVPRLRNEAGMAAKGLAKRDEYAELGRGLAEYNQKLQEKKNQMKSKIMELLDAKGKISNQEAAKALGVSRYSVVRYFDELEEEGKVKQVGKIGQDVIYKKL